MLVLRRPIISDKQNCCQFEVPFGYIYLVRNKLNDKVYVGKHTYHKPKLDPNYKGGGKLLKRAYSCGKYDVNKDFDISILEWVETNNDDLCNAEKFWIVMFNAFTPQNYNCTAGGEGLLGVKHKQSTKQLMRNRNKLTGKSFENLGLEPLMKGKHHSEESRRKMSLSHKGKQTGKDNPMFGKVFSLEHRQKISKTMKERRTTAGKNNPNYNKKFTQEHKQKLSQSHKGLHNNSKAVVQLTLDGVYVNKFDYMSQTGLTINYISQCCKGEKESYKGYRWMYLKDYQEYQKNI